MSFDYDVVVVGGGHAGVEASHAAAVMGMRTLLITLNKHMIANMPCNPHIGGSAKGVVVREVDALGGLMGKAADHRPLQIKMLNTGKGPGVQCLRSQQDKRGYPEYVQKLLESTQNLEILEAEVVDLLHDDHRVLGVILADKKEISSQAVIITTGTYLNGAIISGSSSVPGGPDGEKASLGLTESLERMGVKTWRLKTGTPPRIAKSTIDFSQMGIEEGSDDKLAFSYETEVFTPLSKQLPCYLLYTNDETHRIIHEHLNESALFNGLINSVGPRYCPSIESKLVRFADKPRHQLFLEPEFFEGESFYLQGFSTGMPHDIQEQMVHSLHGLEHAKLLKYAYQIEYDAIEPLQFDATLRVKKYQGLYGAGQIVGTSGYEEAAGLGIMAGINAVLAIRGEPPFILKRNESYIGVMIDDLVTKGTEEPYRLLSSRAEYRLLLRHDNADLRLTEYGYRLGLIQRPRYIKFVEKYKKIDEIISLLSTHNVADREGLNSYFEELGYATTTDGWKGIDILRRPRIKYARLAKLMDCLEGYELDDESILALETKVKYEGYIKKQQKEAEALLREEGMPLSPDIDYLHMDGLRLEARQKLDAVKPLTVAQAARISGVNPADISILLINLRREKK